MADLPSEESLLTIVNLDGIEKLGLAPEEAFVLSRIQGKLSLKEVAQSSGFDVAKAWQILSRLVEAGVIGIEEGSSPKKKSPKGTSILSKLDDEDLDPSLGKILRAKRNEILLRFDKLNQQNHYEVLGVESFASDERIRKAYFKLVKEFHPDRFFGKELGHYKPKLESLFERITKAFDDLKNQAARKAYDEKLQKSSSTE